MLGSLAGQTLGQYQIIEKIGEGGMASVYKALQPSLSRYVAIKTLSSQLATKDPNFAKRFEVEAKAVAALEHPHILPVYDFGLQDEIMYMVMRLVEGGTLTTLMLEHPVLPNERIVKIVSDIAGALDYAHQQGIIHRDIKPSNILIDRHNQVQLTDFGLARMIHSAYTERLTNSGTVVGTASYMSPEQAADESLDGRSDIYSLGVILFELLTGILPFMGDTPVAIALKHINEPIPPMRQFNPTIPEAFEQIVRKAMAKYPEQRFQTAGEMGRALEMAFHGLDTSEMTTIPPRPPKLDELPVDSPPFTGVGLTLGNTLFQPSKDAPLTAQLDSPPDQTVSITTSADASLKKYIWLFGGLGLLVGIFISFFFFFWRTETTPKELINSSPTVVVEATPVPEVPPDSLLNQTPNGSEIALNLGERSNYYSRQPYSRQIFDNGMMYWWDNPDAPINAIIVVYGDIQADSGDKWSRHSDTWDLGDTDAPVDDCPETAGESGPRMGFGKLWCYNPGVRTDLGSPLEPEDGGIDAVVEIFSGGTVFSIPIDNQVWVLLNDGSWQKY